MKFFPKFLDPGVIMAPHGSESPTENEKTSDRQAVVDTQNEKGFSHEPTVVKNTGTEQEAIDSQVISPEAQYGVQKIEATTLAWSKNSLFLAYGM